MWSSNFSHYLPHFSQDKFSDEQTSPQPSRGRIWGIAIRRFGWANCQPMPQLACGKDMGLAIGHVEKPPAFTWKDMGYRNQQIQVRKLSACAPACTWQGYGACDWPCGKHFSLSCGSLLGWWCFYLAKSALKHLIMILYHVHSGHQWYMTSIHVECKVTLNILWHYQFFHSIHTSASTVY